MTRAGPPDDEEQSGRARERLEIVDAVVWALDHGHEVLDIVSAARTTEDAVAEIMRAAGVPEGCASAIVAMQLRRWPIEQVRRLKDERRELREQLGELDGRV